MSSNPFSSKRSASQASQSNRRRSTRVEFAMPVVLSGRNANGQTFREETVTSTVNLHGARVGTRQPILVGMQVTIEIPKNGVVRKAVCVRAGERSEDGTTEYIALQLVRPGNIWGLENPPADWAEVAEQVLGPAAADPSTAAETTGTTPG